jgi:hypothetical protein
MTYKKPRKSIWVRLGPISASTNRTSAILNDKRRDMPSRRRYWISFRHQNPPAFSSRGRFRYSPRTSGPESFSEYRSIDPIAMPALLFLYVALATPVCCNSNIELFMMEILEALFHRRAVRAFEPVEIPQALREQILDAARHAPSSFNMQPYRLFWVESSARKATAAKLCLGQMPAETASALVVAVADIGSMAATSQAQVGWMRRSGFSYAKIRDYERTAKIGRTCSCQGRSAFLARSNGRFFDW